jgi:hypothetical protein
MARKELTVLGRNKREYVRSRVEEDGILAVDMGAVSPSSSGSREHDRMTWPYLIPVGIALCYVLHDTSRCKPRLCRRRN